MLLLSSIEEEYNTSYELGYDNISGWGERYFYTYYSEFGNRPIAIVIETSILIVTLIASIAANTLIACAICQYREMRNTTNYFLLNLTLADLVFAFSIPPIAYTRITQNWQLGDIACKIVPYSQFVCCFVLLWTLTLISMDRYRCIVVPPYRSHLTPTRILLLVAATWVIAITIFLPVVFWFREQHVHDHHIICTLVFPMSTVISYSICFTLPALIFSCILPMSLLVYFYHRIFCKILSSRSRWSVPCVLVTTSENTNSTGNLTKSFPASPRRESDSSLFGSIVPLWARKMSTSSQTNVSGKPRQNSLSQHEEVRLNKHMRVVRLLLLNVVVVLLMWLPITIVTFLIYQDGIRPNDNTDFFLRSHHFVWCLSVALLNTVVNPLLYGVLSENFRLCFRKWWYGHVSKKNSSDSNKCAAPSPINGHITASGGKLNDAFFNINTTANINNNCISIKGTKISALRKNSIVGSIMEIPSAEHV